MDLIFVWCVTWLVTGVLGYFGALIWLGFFDQGVTFRESVLNLWVVLLGPFMLLLVLAAVFFSIPDCFKKLTEKGN